MVVVLRDFIDRGEPVLPGVQPGRHRPRTLVEIIALFAAHRQNLGRRKRQSDARTQALRRHGDEPFYRALMIAWAEQDSIAYQARQRVLLGLYLSAVRLLAIRRITVWRGWHGTNHAIVECPRHGLPAAYQQVYAVGFAPAVDSEWLNPRHCGSYDLSDPALFRRIGWPDEADRARRP